MSLALSSIYAFGSGAAYEFGCVYWVHHAERGRRGRASLWSMFNAAMTVIGIGESIRDWRVAVAYIAGYGAGTYLALRFKPAEKNPP